MQNTLRTNSENPDFIGLVKLLDQDLLDRYGKKQDFFGQFNKLDNIKHVVMLYNGEEPIGCGAIKEYTPEIMEVKRMFIKKESRGQKLGAVVLNELEHWAAELGYTHCILETGNAQPEAIKLYQNNGYHIINNYGQYIGVEESVCMKKMVSAVM